MLVLRLYLLLLLTTLVRLDSRLPLLRCSCCPRRWYLSPEDEVLDFQHGRQSFEGLFLKLGNFDVGNEGLRVWCFCCYRRREEPFCKMFCTFGVASADEEMCPNNQYINLQIWISCRSSMQHLLPLSRPWSSGQSVMGEFLPKTRLLIFSAVSEVQRSAVKVGEVCCWRQRAACLASLSFASLRGVYFASLVGNAHLRG